MGESDGLWSAGFDGERVHMCSVLRVSYLPRLFGLSVYLAREVQGSLANTDTHRPQGRHGPLGVGLPWCDMERDLYY